MIEWEIRKELKQYLRAQPTNDLKKRRIAHSILVMNKTSMKNSWDGLEDDFLLRLYFLSTLFVIYDQGLQFKILLLYFTSNLSPSCWLSIIILN